MITLPPEYLDVATVLEVSQAVSGEIILEKLVEVVLRTAIRHTGAERALLIIPRGSELWIQAEAKNHGDSVVVRLNEEPIAAVGLPESVIRHTVRTQEIVILNDASTQNPYTADAYIRDQRPRSILCLPFLKQSNLVALLYLENNLRSGIFTHARITVLKVLASAAAIALDNSRLYRELQEREGRIQQLVDANIIGVLISDLKGEIVESNDAFLKMVGYTREELVAGHMCWRDMTPPEWKIPSERGVDQVKATGVCQVFEKEYYRKDGSRVPVLVGAARFEKNSIVAFAIDLTERKRAEEELRASEAKYRDLVDTTPAFVHTALPDGYLDFFNRGWLDYLGLSETDLLGWQWTAAIHPEDVEELLKKWRASLESGQPLVVESRVRRVDGKYRWFLHRKQPQRNETGKIVKWYGSSIEIEERKVAEHAIRRSEAFLAEAQRLSHTGSFSWSAATDELTWSEELYRIKGFDRAIKPTFAMVRNRVHPDDRQLWEDAYKKAAQGKEADLKHRVLMPDGALKYFHVTATGVLKDGKLVELIGTVRDITEQKHAEEALRRSEFYLKEGQRLSHAGSSAHDPLTGIIHYWSPETYRIWGCDPEKPPPDKEGITQRIHPEDRQRARKDYDKAVNERSAYDQEYRIVRPDGTVRHIHVVGHPLFGASGELIEYISTLVDVTERKQAEDAVRRSEAFLAEGQRLSHTGSWGWNASTEKVTWSSEHFRILGLDPQAVTPSLELLWDRVHPDDRNKLQHAFASATRDKIDFEQEFRIVTPDWSIRHLYGVGHAVLNEANELVEFIGSAMDITERKRAEEREQSQREAIKLALNAFVEELDVNRFLGDMISEIAKRFRPKSWELWLFEETFGELSLQLSSHSADSRKREAGFKNTRHSEELANVWRTNCLVRTPQVFEFPIEKSTSVPRYFEILHGEGVKKLLLMPLVIGEQNLGFLELHFQSSGKFTADDLELAQALVNHATLALQLNRLTRRAEQLAVTEERNRLAREIHDTLAQAFAGIVLHSEALGASLGVSKRRSAMALSRIKKLARASLDEARRSVQALRPKALDGNTLSEALKQAAKRINQTGVHICHFKQRGTNHGLSMEAQTELFRIAQEALTNVGKHAQAKSIWIDLVFTARRVVLRIRDDGVGLSKTTSAHPKSSYGLATMRERAQRIDAQLKIESPRGGGTSVRACVPFAKADKQVKPNTYI